MVMPQRSAPHPRFKINIPLVVNVIQVAISPSNHICFDYFVTGASQNVIHILSFDGSKPPDGPELSRLAAAAVAKLEAKGQGSGAPAIGHATVG
jgi:hypothetical protein